MKGGRKSRWRTGVVAIGSIAEMTDDLNKRVLNRGLGDTNLGDVVLKASNAFQASFSCEGRLSGWLLEKAVETGMSTAPTRRIVGAFASHFLLSAGIAGARNSVQGLDRLEVPFVWARRVVVVVLLLDAGRRVAVGLVHGWMRRGERGRAE
jgi:hypothetical protein